MIGRRGQLQCDVCGSHVGVIHISELGYLRPTVAGWIQELCRVHAGWYDHPRWRKSGEQTEARATEGKMNP